MGWTKAKEQRRSEIIECVRTHPGVSVDDVATLLQWKYEARTIRGVLCSDPRIEAERIDGLWLYRIKG